MEANNFRILVVDDEMDLCDILRFNLEAKGYEVTTAASAEEALTLDLPSYSLLLLDVMMGGIDGFTLASKLKQQPATAHLPIIFLTAKDTERDTLRGFDLGADDYISKPFSIREVMARVQAVLRRSLEQHATGTETQTVCIDGADVPFSKTEFELLLLLLQERGRVFSRQELINRIWPKDVLVLDRTVDVNITRMRKKIGNYASHLVTRLGYGYYFEE